MKKWRADALKLRIQGHTYAEIATKLKKSIGAVHKGIQAEINAVPVEDVEHLRMIEGSRLETIIRGHLGKAGKGDCASGFVVISAVSARAKLFGLNEIEKVDVSQALTVSLDAHEALMQRLDKLAGSAKSDEPAAPDDTTPEQK